MLSDFETRMHSACFTGHRPEKLCVTEQKVVLGLEDRIDEAIADGYHTFITGMARGVDIWAAEIIIQRKKNNSDLKLICALPYDGFEKSWSIDWQKRYRNILERADVIQAISAGYSKACFQKRNEWMVDHSTRVIAVWNGKPSGTKNTIDYANSKSVDVENILDNK